MAAVRDYFCYGRIQCPERDADVRHPFPCVKNKGTTAIFIPIVVCSFMLGALNLGLTLEIHSKKLPAAIAVESVPFVKQHGDWCGPAALASVLQFYGEKITQEQIAKEIYLPQMRGSLNIDLLLYARRKGYASEVLQGNILMLKGRGVSKFIFAIFDECVEHF